MGLTEKEAAEKLKADGLNVFGENKKTGAMKIFLGQFRDVMVMILLGATVISVLLGEISDAVTIILIVLLNAVLGFIQEYRTENTLEALRSMTAPTAKCRRDGKLRVIDASLLVTGDIIEIESGDRIPADCTLLSASGLFTDESLLTGESEAVAKTVGAADDKDNSIGRPLPKRTNIVITSKNIQLEGCHVFHSVEDGIKFAESQNENELFIIGGLSIYKYCQEKGLLDRIYLTKFEY